MEKEWKELLEVNQNIYIYGAGKIGKKIFKLIKQKNQLDKIKGFLVSDKAGNPDYIENIPVLQIGELVNKDGLILLSVTDTYQEEILSLLSAYGYDNVVCAYKFSFLDIDNDISADKMPDTIVIDTRELLIQQYINGKYNRMDIIVRLLAVENYYQMNEYGFGLYEKMQETRVREGYSDTSVKRFKALIESFEQRGYDRESEIIVDSNLRLIDGAHRLALAIYYKVPNVKIRIDKSIRDINYGIEWFQKNFLSEDCEILEEKLEAVAVDWGRPIKGIIWPNAMDYKNEITEYIDRQYHVLAYKDYQFPKEIFTRFVKGVYQIDDITEWKVNSKIEHFTQMETLQVRVLDIQIEIPNFRVKNVGKTISQTGEKLKKEVREVFKSRVDNYFYDIVFHTADNYYQSEYMDALIPEMFSLRPFFSSISGFNWMLVKTDNDYFPKDFPDSWPIYKDIDIITDRKDAEEIKKKAIDFLANYRDGKYYIKVVNRGFGYLIRFELERFLIFQIDISFSNEYLSEKFMIRSLNNKVEKDGYYVSIPKDECVYRFMDYIAHPDKKKHLQYILSYFERENNYGG